MTDTDTDGERLLEMLTSSDRAKKIKSEKQFVRRVEKIIKKELQADEPDLCLIEKCYDILLFIDIGGAAISEESPNALKYRIYERFLAKLKAENLKTASKTNAPKTAMRLLPAAATLLCAAVLLTAVFAFTGLSFKDLFQPGAAETDAVGSGETTPEPNAAVENENPPDIAYVYDTPTVYHTVEEMSAAENVTIRYPERIPEECELSEIVFTRKTDEIEILFEYNMLKESEGGASYFSMRLNIGEKYSKTVFPEIVEADGKWMCGWVYKRCAFVITSSDKKLINEMLAAYNELSESEQ